MGNINERVASLETKADIHQKEHEEFKEMHKTHTETFKKVAINQDRNHTRINDLEKFAQETNDSVAEIKTIASDYDTKHREATGQMGTLIDLMNVEKEKKEAEAEDIKKRKRDLLFSVLKFLAIAFAGYFAGKYLGIKI